MVAVQAPAGLTVSVQVTLPDLTAGPLLVLTDIDGDGHYEANYTPTVVGDYWLIIESPGAEVDGLAAVLTVSAAGAGGALPGGSGYISGACPGDLNGSIVLWPCPKLSSLDCIDNWTADQIADWLSVATATLFDDTCRRFPGCESYALIRPQASSSCLAWYDGHWGLDLFPTVRYPVIELVDVIINGVSSAETDSSLPGWEIRGKRYLVPTGSNSWPSQDFRAPNGAPGTWSVLVRYGRPVPPLLLKARDQFAYSMLIDNEPTATGSMACKLPDGTTQLVESGRVIQRDPSVGASILYEQAKKRWGCPKKGPMIYDPAEPTARNSSYTIVVDGDHTPADVLAFRGSGCNVQSQLDALSP